MSKRCARCEKTVYPLEELKCLDKIWHKGCFKCQECAMTLSMKTYKGFNKLPYCEAHIPKAKATTVAETPEMKRLAENTKNQSNVQYHAEFEKNKAKFTQVDDDPETLRLKKNSKIISNVSYHGELEKKAVMEKRRGEPGDEDYDAANRGEFQQPTEVTKAPTKQPFQPPAQHNQQQQPVHHMPPQQQQHMQHVPPTQHHVQPQQQQQHVQPPQQHVQPPQQHVQPPQQHVQAAQQQVQASQHHVQPPQQHHMQHQAAQQQYPPNYQSQQGFQQYHQHNQGYQHQHANSNRPTANFQTQQYQSSNVGYQQAPKTSTTYHHHPNQDSNHNYSNQNSQTLIYSSQTGPVQQESTRRVGRISDYDPVNEQYGSLSQTRSYPQQRNQPRYDQEYQSQQMKQQAFNSQNAHKVNAPPTSLGRCFRAMYDYEAADTDEVSFRDGDLIINCTKIDEGWMTGTLQRTGQSGMLPANYVERVS